MARKINRICGTKLGGARLVSCYDKMQKGKCPKAERDFNVAAGFKAGNYPACPIKKAEEIDMMTEKFRLA